MGSFAVRSLISFCSTEVEDPQLVDTLDFFLCSRKIFVACRCTNLMPLALVVRRVVLAAMKKGACVVLLSPARVRDELKGRTCRYLSRHFVFHRKKINGLKRVLR
jgi:hypothetical protein